MPTTIIGTLTIIRSNFSLGLMCYGVLRRKDLRNIITANRVIVKNDGLLVVPSGVSPQIAPNEQFYEVGLAGAPAIQIDHAANEFAKMLVRNFTADSFEALKDYCTQTNQFDLMKEQAWFQFARMIRNSLTHTQHWRFNDGDKKRLPVEWNGKTIDIGMDNHELSGSFYDWFDACELWDEMHEFAQTLK